MIIVLRAELVGSNQGIFGQIKLCSIEERNPLKNRALPHPNKLSHNMMRA